jgi:DNA polymerase-1
MKNTESYAVSNGYVETIFGRKCFIPLINSRNRNLLNFAKRQAINAPIQGSNADIIKLAMVKLNETKNLKADPLLQIHDELVFEAADRDVSKTVDIVRNIMENVISLKVPIVVSVRSTKSL